jgi:ankyrin repeat protein
MEGQSLLVTAFIEKGADPNLTDYEDSTALMRSALNGHVPSVELLLNKGSDPNFQSKLANRWTILMAAAHGGSQETVEALLKAGADPKIKADPLLKDDQGKTALDYAKEKSLSEMINLLSKVSTSEAD